MKKLTGILALLMVLCLTLPVFAQEEIVYWAQWSETETQAAVIKDSVARFEADNPDYKVNVNWAGREVRDILKTSLDSGATIDIVEGGFDRLPQTVGIDYFLDLDKYIKDTDFGKSIIPSMLQFVLSLGDGEHYYYLPAQPFIGAIFYNKDIFDEVGVTEPATWEEFLDVCQKIKDAGYDPLTVDDAYVSLLYSQYLGLIKGEEWLGELLTDKTGALWGDPAILQMAKAFEELSAKGYFSETVGSNVFPSAQNGELAIGTTAMYFNGSWLPNEVAAVTGPDFRWGIMFFPGVENAIHDYKTLMNGCQVYAVNKNTKVADGAVKLLEYLCDKTTQQALVDQAQCMPVVDGCDWPASLADADKLMNAATGTFVWGVAKKSDTEVTALLNDAFHRLIGGSITADQFVSEMQEKIHQ